MVPPRMVTLWEATGTRIQWALHWALPANYLAAESLAHLLAHLSAVNMGKAVTGKHLLGGGRLACGLDEMALWAGHLCF